MMRKLFLDHPATVGESYLDHLEHALGFALAMLIGAVACLIHAIVPGLCVSTGSTIIGKLHRRMVSGRTPDWPAI